jgi:hypothetical protein
MNKKNKERFLVTLPFLSLIAYLAWVVWISDNYHKIRTFQPAKSASPAKNTPAM